MVERWWRELGIVVEGAVVGKMHLVRSLRHLREGRSMLLKCRLLYGRLMRRHHVVIEWHTPLELRHVLASVVIGRSKWRTAMLETRHGLARVGTNRK